MKKYNVGDIIKVNVSGNTTLETHMVAVITGINKTRSSVFFGEVSVCYIAGKWVGSTGVYSKDWFEEHTKVLIRAKRQ